MKYSVHNLQTGNRPAPAGYNSWIEYWKKQRVLRLITATFTVAFLKPLMELTFS